MHLNFKVYNVTVAAIIAALAIAPCVMFLPESYGFEMVYWKICSL